MTVTHRWSGDGLAPGPLTTTTNGPGDTPYSVVSPAGLTIDNTGVRPPRIRVAKPVGAACYKEWAFPARTAGAYREIWVEPTAAQASSYTLLTVRDGTTHCFRLSILSTTGALRAFDQTVTQVGSSGLNTTTRNGGRYRIEVIWTHGSTTGGFLEYKVFSGDTTTQVGDTTTLTGINIGTQHTRVIMGSETATTEVDPYYFDDAAVADTAVYIGPYTTAVNQPPVVNAGPDQTVASGAPVTLIGTATDDLGIASYTWSKLNTAAQAVNLVRTGNTATFTAPYYMADTPLTFRFTATDTGGLTSDPDDVWVTVKAHPQWFKNADATFSPITGGTIAAPSPVTVTANVTTGDGFADVAWTVAPGGHAVTGVTIRKTPTISTITRNTITGTYRFTGLTNGTVYTFTVTPIVDGATDSTYAVTATGTPQPAQVKQRGWGLYTGDYAEDAIRTTFGTRVVNGVTQRKYPDWTSSYVQWGPDKTAAPTFPNFQLANEQAQADKGVNKLLAFTTKGTNVVADIGNGRAANPAGYDFAITVIDAWIAKVRQVYAYAPDRPLYATMNVEPDVMTHSLANTANGLSGDGLIAGNHGRFYDVVFGRFRASTGAPGVKLFVWLGGSQTQWIDDMLSAMTVPPDLFTIDIYANAAGATTITKNLTPDLNNFRAATGAWRGNYDRLSALPRPGVAANSGTKIPLAGSEHGIDRQDHTDQEMADYLTGGRAALVTLDLEFLIYFNSDAGPLGDHRLDTGTTPLALAAFRDELFGDTTTTPPPQDPNPPPVTTSPRRFKTGCWYEKPLPSNAPTHLRSAEYLTYIAATDQGETGVTPYLNFVGGANTATDNMFWPASYVSKGTDRVYKINANGRTCPTEFTDIGVRIPEVAKTYYALLSTNNDLPFQLYSPSGVGPITRPFYMWAAMLQWSDTEWILTGTGAAAGVYYADTFGHSADNPKAGTVTPATLPGSGRSPSYYIDEPKNGGFRGCNAMIRTINYDRVKNEGQVNYVMEMFQGNLTAAEGRWPMTGFEDKGTGGKVPEGTRLRIKPSVDVSAVLATDTGYYGNPATRTADQAAAFSEAVAIARGLQVYGIMVADNSGAANNVKLSNPAKEGRADMWKVRNDGLRKLLFTTHYEVIQDSYDPPDPT